MCTDTFPHKMIILFFMAFVGCSSAFQQKLYSTISAPKTCVPSRDIIRSQQTLLGASKEELSPSKKHHQILAQNNKCSVDPINSKNAVWTRRNIVSSLLTITCLPHASFASESDETNGLVDPTAPFTVMLTVQTDAKKDETLEIEIEVRPDWAPLASNRFKELVQSGFYNDARFFRVLPGYVAQFGIAADPKLNKEWMLCEKNCRALPDEPRKENNKRGTLSFASSGKDSRQTQVFINLGNNDGFPNFLDGQDFVPFARVVRGMDDTVKKLNSEYGIVETVSAGLAGGVNQGKAAYYGAEYLDAAFPKLSIIRNAKII